MDSEETLKYLQQKYPEDLNENYRCYWWCTSNIDGSALTYYLVLHDKFCETDKEPMICLRAHSYVKTAREFIKIDRCYQLLQKRYRIESLYELAKNYAQIEWRCIEFR